jgi:hypothetical protein
MTTVDRADHITCISAATVIATLRNHTKSNPAQLNLNPNYVLPQPKPKPNYLEHLQPLALPVKEY